MFSTVFKYFPTVFSVTVCPRFQHKSNGSFKTDIKARYGIQPLDYIKKARWSPDDQSVTPEEVYKVKEAEPGVENNSLRKLNFFI